MGKPVVDIFQADSSKAALRNLPKVGQIQLIAERGPHLEFYSCFDASDPPRQIALFDAPQADAGELPAFAKLIAAFQSQSRKNPQLGQINVLSRNFNSLWI